MILCKNIKNKKIAELYKYSLAEPQLKKIFDKTAKSAFNLIQKQCEIKIDNSKNGAEYRKAETAFRTSKISLIDKCLFLKILNESFDFNEYDILRFYTQR